MAAFCHELEACLRELSRDADGTQIIAPRAAPPRRARRGVSPWPVLAADRRAARDRRGRRGARPDRPHAGAGGRHVGRRRAPVHADRGRRVRPVRARAARTTSSSHYATDGNDATYWKTEHYYDAPSLGQARRRVGARRGAAVALHELGDRHATPGFVAVIKGRRLADVVHEGRVSTPQTVADGTRVHDLRRVVPLLRDLDHAARPELPRRADQRGHRNLSAFRSETLRTDSPRRWPRVRLRSGKSSGSTVSRARGRTGTSLTSSRLAGVARNVVRGSR